MTNYFDVHCHLQLTKDLTNIKINEITTKKMAIMATCPEDWETVANLASQHPDRVIPGFGIHPWWVNSASSSNNWEAELRSYLEKFPSSILGEIGLDKVAKDRANDNKLFPFDEQIELFKKQLKLAHTLKKPISVHCVKCEGTLIENFILLKGSLPEKIMLHSYSGSLDTLKRLFKLEKELKTKFYFSFAKIINCKTDKYKATLLNIPADRILIESDNNEFEMVDELMSEVGVLVEEVVPNSLDRIYENSLEFYTIRE
jgi:TatD DNase family protein